MFIIKLALHGLLLILAYMLVILGLDWIELGAGLNPWIAFPIALVILAGVTYNTMLGIYNDHLERKHQEHLRRNFKNFNL